MWANKWPTVDLGISLIWINTSMWTPNSSSSYHQSKMTRKDKVAWTNLKRQSIYSQIWLKSRAKVQIPVVVILLTFYAFVNVFATEMDAKSKWHKISMRVAMRFFLGSLLNVNLSWRKILRESNSRFKERTFMPKNKKRCWFKRKFCN